MSAERYKITDDGASIIIAESNGIRSSIDPVDGQHLDDIVIGAIRQQARDIDSRDAVIAACAEAVGASVSPGCSDEFRAMLPGEILAALAAVVAERDRYHYQALTLDMLAARTLGDEPAEDAIMEKMDNLPDSKNPSGHLIACVIAERDQLRAQLGPALGLVEIREPTPEECERICTEYERLLMREGTCGGRDAFDAVRAVMWPKSEVQS